MSYCVSISFACIGVVDLCPLYEVLLVEVGTEFTDDHLITHPCGHWVLRKLLEVAKNEENSPAQSGTPT